MKIKKIRCNLFKPIKRHSLYYRILVPFSIFSIVIVCITAWANWNLIAKKYEAKTKETNRQILKQVQLYTDHQLYENFMSILNDNFLNGFSQSNLDLFFLYGKQLESSELLKSFQLINDICNKNPLIKNITLYQKRNDILLDSKYGLSYNSLSNAGNIDESLPFSYYNEAVLNTQEQLRYLASYALPENKRSDLTLIKSLPLYSDFSSCHGYFAINIDESLFLRTLKKEYPLQGGLFVLDEHDRLLLSTDTFLMSYDEFGKIVTADEIIPSNDYYDFSFHDIRYSYTVLVSGSSRWKYLYYIPKDTLNAEGIAIRQLVITIVLLTILSSLIIIPIISNRIYKPILSLRSNLSSRHEELELTDDLDAIQNTLMFLESQVDDMKNTISQNKDVMQYKCFTDLLYKNNISAEEIHKRLALSDVVFHEADYCLIIIEIDKIVFYSLSLEQQEYITAKILDITRERYCASLLQMVEPSTDNRIVALINLAKENYASLLMLQYELNEAIRNNLHININIAITDLINDLSLLKKAYQITGEYLKYSFLYRYGNVFTSETIKQLESNHHEWDIKDYQQLEALIRNDKLEELTGIIHGYSEEIYSKKYSYTTANNFLIQVYKAVFRVGKELGILEDEKNKDQVLLDFNNTTYFEQSIENILSILRLFHDTYNKIGENNNAELVKQIISYISNNGQEELSLSSVAEHFNISSSHLSRVFKCITGENFSVYVVNAKLETAASLLSSDPVHSITEIAASLGYYSSSYFTKLFKNKYGITPSQYQKLKQFTHEKG